MVIVLMPPPGVLLVYFVVTSGAMLLEDEALADLGLVEVVDGPRLVLVGPDEVGAGVGELREVEVGASDGPGFDELGELGVLDELGKGETESPG